MSKNNKLSHSSASTYITCGHKYKLHYIDKIRSTQTHAALLFGSALDKALDAMLQDHKRNSIDYLGTSYVSLFNNNWRKGEINKEIVDIVDNPNIVYAETDVDWELFSPADYNTLLGVLQNKYSSVATLKVGDAEEIKSTYKEIGKLKRSDGWSNLAEDKRRFYNFTNWLSMSIKGKLMISAYLTQVIPRIKKVISTQQNITIKGTDGDSITGFVDLVAEWEDGRVVVFDNKTSAREYEHDAVLKSPQLALYSHALEHDLKTRTAGFIVLRKLIDKDMSKTCASCGANGDDSRAKTCVAVINNKRCSGEWIKTTKPKAVIQVLINDIPAQLEKITMENFIEVNHAIKAEVFPRNLSACEQGSWRCPYYNLCHHNSLRDLVKIEEK